MMALALWAVVGAAPAMAADPVPLVFYNRPGARPRDVEADLRRCRLATTGPAAGAERPDGAVLLDQRSRAGAPVQDMQGCMVANGWRVFALSERERQLLAHLKPKARARLWAGLVGRAVPGMGRLVDGREPRGRGLVSA